MEPVRVGVRQARYRTYIGLFVLVSLPAFLAMILSGTITSVTTAFVVIAVLVVLLVLWLTPHDMNVGLCFIEEEAVEESGRLDAHLAFGFTADPVFPELEWDEDEE